MTTIINNFNFEADKKDDLSVFNVIYGPQSGKKTLRTDSKKKKTYEDGLAEGECNAWGKIAAIAQQQMNKEAVFERVVKKEKKSSSKTTNKVCGICKGKRYSGHKVDEPPYQGKSVYAILRERKKTLDAAASVKQTTKPVTKPAVVCSIEAWENEYYTVWFTWGKYKVKEGVVFTYLPDPTVKAKAVYGRYFEYKGEIYTRHALTCKLQGIPSNSTIDSSRLWGDPNNVSMFQMRKVYTAAMKNNKI